MYAELGRGGVRLTAAAPLFHRPALDDHLQNVYHPKWSRLMMHEGQAGYPLPAASQVNDLLSALQGVSGQAVSSSGVNGKQGVVSEGQAYAMLSAGMRNDTALLKALTVGWQAQVQGVAGEHAIVYVRLRPEGAAVPGSADARRLMHALAVEAVEKDSREVAVVNTRMVQIPEPAHAGSAAAAGAGERNVAAMAADSAHIALSCRRFARKIIRFPPRSRAPLKNLDYPRSGNADKTDRKPIRVAAGKVPAQWRLRRESVLSGGFSCQPGGQEPGGEDDGGQIDRQRRILRRISTEKDDVTQRNARQRRR